ncbi:MAG: hypothetical protein LBE31_07735 [Deltaproteobacteria bacterium]|nr:hypothetical protein [Deltaproteobacteria bacterium]
MSRTDAEVQAMLARLDDVKNEIVRIDAMFDQNMASAGLTVEDLKKIDQSQLPPEVKKAVDEVKREAQLACEQVSRDLQFQNQPKSPKRSARAGAIKL